MPHKNRASVVICVSSDCLTKRGGTIYGFKAEQSLIKIIVIGGSIFSV